MSDINDWMTRPEAKAKPSLIKTDAWWSPYLAYYSKLDDERQDAYDRGYTAGYNDGRNKK